MVRLSRRRALIGMAILCLVLAFTVFWTHTEGPVGDRIEQVRHGELTASIERDAAAKSASAQYRWNLWIRGGDHNETLRSMESLISACLRNGDLADAEKLALSLLATKEARLGADHWETLNAHHDLGFILWRRKEYVASEKHFRRAFEGRLRTLGTDHWATANAADMLSHPLDRQAKPGEALVIAQVALQGYTRDPNPNIPSTSKTHQERRLLDYISSLQAKANGQSVQ